MLLNKLKKYDTVIIGYHQSSSRNTFAISKKESFWIQKISENNTVIFNVFSSLYCLTNLLFNNIDTVLIAYENSKNSQKIVPQIIFGEKTASGKLPASINNEFPTNFGIETNRLSQLK